MQVAEKIKVEVSFDIEEIKIALQNTLYVPNAQVKGKVIDEIIQYLKKCFSDPDYKINPLIAFHNGTILGFVLCCIDPHYTSYSRKCGNFGWLHAASLDVCKNLMRECEQFFKKNKIRRLRGPINLPKSMGGIGIQFIGFQEQMLYGAAFSNPQAQVLSYLEDLGYKKESEYSCVYVTQKIWNTGKKVDKDIVFRYFPLNQLYDYIDAIEDLAQNTLYQIMSDSSGIHRIYEFFNAFSKIPDTFYTIPQDFEPANYSEIPQFVEIWESSDIGKIQPFAPMAFDKKSGELVGILLGLPDLYEKWVGHPITRANVDTAMVKKGYYGKGIFSALNNIGQLTCNLFGINYFEGTNIWSNNSRAIDTIFPHCNLIRKHYVVQKRL